MGKKVPDVLLSGHHGRIAEWRREQSLKRTLIRRPELLETAELSQKDKKTLQKIKKKVRLSVELFSVFILFCSEKISKPF